ncbi:hypothetical protein FB550_102415 [Neobacillus bataviensis]|uniref:Uncharacterized protein n=1 Tax=Neobacillus bataviensis TaxID=220685 RepID=A0A561DSQ0_9BACI|nr:hypothetical protein [Neobacillus bataviensis]TWE06393.1 hypothetical protein FB550_102415 [Neobacillus bataviensis]
MAANNKELKLANGKVAPQFYDEIIDDYIIARGSNGAPYYREQGSIAMESWEGSTNITQTFTSDRYGFSVINDGTADLTFTINSQTRKVKPGEAYSALFEPFTSVVITTSSDYRAEVLR